MFEQHVEGPLVPGRRAHIEPAANRRFEIVLTKNIMLLPGFQKQKNLLDKVSLISKKI
jgi:hypothetical protein